MGAFAVVGLGLDVDLSLKNCCCSSGFSFDPTNARLGIAFGLKGNIPVASKETAPLWDVALCFQAEFKMSPNCARVIFLEG